MKQGAARHRQPSSELASRRSFGTADRTTRCTRAVYVWLVYLTSGTRLRAASSASTSPFYVGCTDRHDNVSTTDRCHQPLSSAIRRSLDLRASDLANVHHLRAGVSCAVIIILYSEIRLNTWLEALTSRIPVQLCGDSDEYYSISFELLSYIYFQTTLIYA